jgi:tRNA pseudouridine13 synthase
MRLEEKVGIRTFLSKSDGIGGTIKAEPEDFLVEEIRPDGTVLEIGQNMSFPVTEGEYIHFTLEKKNWDTMRAIKVISKKCGVSQKRFNYAGTKDRRSISTQRVSSWNIPKETLEKFTIKDITLRDFSVSDERINLGDLKGNRFTIRVGEVSKDADKKVMAMKEELGGKAPNFFGTQRFGMRLNNHIVGKHALKGEFKEAAMEFLCGDGDNAEVAQKARKNLRETEDFQAALNEFPNYLGFEKSLLNHLVRFPTDFIGAMRELPKKLRWMFIHAYQGYIFNLTLSEYIEMGELPEELPLVGYTTGPDKVSEKILKKEGIKQDDFKVAAMPEMTSEGEMRKAVIPFSDLEVVDFNEKDSNLWVRFSLPPGAYATIVLRELMK